MTDNEIIKVIESSKECCDDDVNVFEFLNEVIDLINRQKAEIERYKGVIKILENDASKAKSETIEEFARRLKEAVGLKTLPSFVIKILIDELVKEMMKEK